MASDKKEENTLTFLVFDPRTRAIPLFNYVDNGIGAGNQIYTEMLGHFISHYNFLSQRVGRKGLASHDLDYKLLWYMMYFLADAAPSFMVQFQRSVDKSIEKKNLVPYAIFPLEVEISHFPEKLYSEIPSDFKHTRLKTRPSELAISRGYKGYLDIFVHCWASVSGDGSKIYVTQAFDFLFDWFFMVFLAEIQASFSWHSFRRQSGDHHFKRLLDSYDNFWGSYEEDPPETLEQLYDEIMPSREAFSDFFTSFRIRPNSEIIADTPETHGDKIDYDFVESWGGFDLLRSLCADLVADFYLKFFLGLSASRPRMDSEQWSILRENHPFALADYIWNGKPSFFFLWDFMLSWKFGDYFVDMDFYQHSQGKNFNRLFNFNSDNNDVFAEGQKEEILYDRRLLADSERDDLLFFVEEAKKNELKASGLTDSGAENILKGAWTIFCFSTDILSPFRQGENLNRNQALVSTPLNPLVRPRVTSWSPWNNLVNRYVLLSYQAKLEASQNLHSGESSA